MSKYRISKYIRQSVTGNPTLWNEWTDYSDIGIQFGETVLTEQEYLRVEQNYVRCIIDILHRAEVRGLYIEGLENYNNTSWMDHQLVSMRHLPELICDCLRNKCWCRLINVRSYVHFGYDYYVYMAVDLPHEQIKEICRKYGLVCEKQDSPYSK